MHAGLISYRLNKFPNFRQVVSGFPLLQRLLNRFFSNGIFKSGRPQSYPFSRWGPAAGVDAFSQALMPRLFPGNAFSEERFSAPALAALRETSNLQTLAHRHVTDRRGMVSFPRITEAGNG